MLQYLYKPIYVKQFYEYLERKRYNYPELKRLTGIQKMTKNGRDRKKQLKMKKNKKNKYFNALKTK